MGSHGITEVAFVAYKNGAIIGSMRFDGTGTDNVNWFSKGKLNSNTVWNDLSSQSNNYFSIAGHASIHRRFFVHHSYAGCSNDYGWFVNVDTPSPACDWDQHWETATPTASTEAGITGAAGARAL